MSFVLLSPLEFLYRLHDKKRMDNKHHSAFRVALGTVTKNIRSSV